MSETRAEEWTKRLNNIMGDQAHVSITQWYIAI
jgi:hypothetical protein